MTTSSPLSRMRLAARLCAYGAVIIGIMGLILTILYILMQWPALVQSPRNLFLAFNLAVIVFLIAALTLFFALTLYTLGALLQYLIRAEKTQEEDHERIEIVAIPSLQPLQEEV